MYVHMCHTTHSVYISIEKSEGCCEECVFAVQGYSVYVYILCRIEHVLYAVHECRTWEEGGELGFGGRMAVHSIGMYAMLVCTLCMCGCP